MAYKMVDCGLKITSEQADKIMKLANDTNDQSLITQVSNWLAMPSFEDHDLKVLLGYFDKYADAQLKINDMVHEIMGVEPSPTKEVSNKKQEKDDIKEYKEGKGNDVPEPSNDINVSLQEKAEGTGKNAKK